MRQRIRELVKKKELIRVFTVGQLCHPKVVEIIGHTGGYHAVWLDQEHCGLSIQQIEDATRAARSSNIDVFVRLHATDYATTMRPFEAGAGGIMAAQVRSAKQVEEIVRWSKFYPNGLRGVNGLGIDGRYGTIPAAEYMKKAN